jgi:hypothetical protein
MSDFVGNVVSGVGDLVGGAVDTVKDVASSPLGKAALIGGGLYATGGLGGLGLGGGAASTLPEWAAGITDAETLSSLGLGGGAGLLGGAGTGGLAAGLAGLSTGQMLGLGAGALALSGGLGNKPTSSTTTTSIDPEMKAAYLRNLEEARTTAAGLGEKQLADFTAKYGTAEQQLESLGLGGAGQTTTNEAARLALQEAGYTPQQIAAQTGAQYMSAYRNPYENQVVQGALGDIERQRQMSQQAQQARASAAKAFGGSRQAVAEALANEDYTRQAANTAAQLRSQGFTTAAQLGQTDAARMLAAAQANQAALAQGAGIRQAAIGQLGALGAQQQNLGMTGAQAVMGAQQQRQALAQARLDAARNLELERLGIRQSALGLQPANLGGTQTSPIYRNTSASALGGALSGGMLGNLIGGSTGAGYGALIGGGLGLLG